jgi:hypothetical protein
VTSEAIQLIQQGKTAEEATAAKLNSEYDSRVQGATAQTADRFVGQLYAELKGTR